MLLPVVLDVCLWTYNTVTGMSAGLLMALLGKSAVTGSFAIIYLYSAELFPTEVRYVCSTTQLDEMVCSILCAIIMYRSIGLGVANVGSRVGGILSSLLPLLVSFTDITSHAENSLNFCPPPPPPCSPAWVQVCLCH